MNLGMISKKKKKQSLKENGQKEEGLNGNKIVNDLEIIKGEQKGEVIQHPLVYYLFHFLLNLIEQPAL